MIGNRDMKGSKAECIRAQHVSIGTERGSSTVPHDHCERLYLHVKLNFVVYDVTNLTIELRSELN